MTTDPNLNGNEENGYKNKPLTISELAKKHLNDPDHTTSDEELRNAKLELTDHVEVDAENLHQVHETTVFPPMNFEKETPSKNKQEDNDESHSDGPPNPYDILR
jgi:hypothetical protein